MRKRKWMISIFTLVISTALLSGLTKTNAATQSAKDACARDKQAPAAGKHESPFACDRLALNPEMRKRHFDEIGPALRAKRLSVRELTDGYEFQFPTDPQTIAMVAEWAAAERLCCPFFDIDLRMEREGGEFWMRLTGRKGTKDFIKVDASSWTKPVSKSKAE